MILLLQMYFDDNSYNTPNAAQNNFINLNDSLL